MPARDKKGGNECEQENRKRRKRAFQQADLVPGNEEKHDAGENDEIHAGSEERGTIKGHFSAPSGGAGQEPIGLPNQMGRHKAFGNKKNGEKTLRIRKLPTRGEGPCRNHFRRKLLYAGRNG